MGIGTSRGAFYRDEAHYQASRWDERYDDNEMIISPQELQDRKDYPVPTLAGKDNTMPFPDNKNPDSTFDSRFGKLPPSGILNDLKKPTGDTVPLVRKIGYIQNEIQGGPTIVENFPDILPTPRNDNKEGLYNPREPDMIGSAQLDAWTNALNQHFEDTVNKPAKDFIKRYDELHAHGEWMTQPGNYSEVAVAKYNKLGRALGGRESDNKGDWEDLKYEAPIKYEEGKSEARPETVGRAALKHDKEIFHGVNHGEAFEKLINKYPNIDFTKVKDGFLTSNHRFVSREEAFDIAKAADQITDKGVSDDDRIYGLLSEDIQ